MRLIIQLIAGDFELCARLGLVFVPPSLRLQAFDGSKIVHAVLEGSPGAAAGIQPRDILLTVDRTPLHAVQHLTFSDRRPSDITVKTFVARYFTLVEVVVRVPPNPYRLLDDIAREAADALAARPVPDATPYRNPRFDDLSGLMASLRRRRPR